MFHFLESYRVTLPLCLANLPDDFGPESEFFVKQSANITNAIEMHFDDIPGTQTVELKEFLLVTEHAIFYYNALFS